MSEDNVKICASVLTWNHITTGRADMFARTCLSLTDGGVPVSVRVITNGSTDGTQDVVRRLGGIVDDTYTQVWYGMERGIEDAIERGGDIVLFTADDIEYKHGWAEKLLAFWQDAPDEVIIACLFLEDCWPWNTVRGYLDTAGGRALLRDSVPGSCWSFRARDWAKIAPLPRIMPGEDMEVVKRLTGQGYLLAALDLATHTGEAHSAWGNQSHTWSVPLDRARWGL